MCSSSTLGKSKHFIRSLPFHTPQKQWCVKSMIFTQKKSRKTCLGSKISLHSSPISWTRANGSQTVFWGSLCGILLCNCKWLCNLEREAMNSSVVGWKFTKSKNNPLKKEKKLLYPDKHEKPYLLSSAIDNNNILVGLIPSISRVLLHLRRS